MSVLTACALWLAALLQGCSFEADGQSSWPYQSVFGRPVSHACLSGGFAHPVCQAVPAVKHAMKTPNFSVFIFCHMLFPLTGCAMKGLAVFSVSALYPTTSCTTLSLAAISGEPLTASVRPPLAGSLPVTASSNGSRNMQNLQRLSRSCHDSYPNTDCTKCFLAHHKPPASYAAQQVAGRACALKSPWSGVCQHCAMLTQA